MTDEKIQNNDKDNAELIYQHTLGIVKEKRDSIVRLDAKIGALLAFQGFSLRQAGIDINLKVFTWPIPIYEPIFWYSFCKILSYAFVLCSVFYCIKGLIVISAGGTVNPMEMLKSEIFENNMIDNKRNLIATWNETNKEYEEVLNSKQKNLNTAFHLTFLSIVIVTISNVLSNFLITP